MEENFVSVAIIYNSADKTVLLQHRDNKPEISGPNQWGLFGGHGTNDETPKQALARELQEELGFQFKESKLEPINDYISAYGNERFVFLINSTPDAMPIKLSEGQGFAWVPSESVLNYDLTIGARKDLEIFLKRESPNNFLI